MSEQAKQQKSAKNTPRFAYQDSSLEHFMLCKKIEKGNEVIVADGVYPKKEYQSLVESGKILETELQTFRYPIKLEKLEKAIQAQAAIPVENLPDRQRSALIASFDNADVEPVARTSDGNLVVARKQRGLVDQDVANLLFD